MSINCDKFFKDPEADLILGGIAGGSSALVASLYAATGVLKDVTVPHGLLYGVTFGAIFVVTYEVLGLFCDCDAVVISMIASAIFATIAASLIVGAITGTFTLAAGCGITATLLTTMVALFIGMNACSDS